MLAASKMPIAASTSGEGAPPECAPPPPPVPKLKIPARDAPPPEAVTDVVIVVFTEGDPGLDGERAAEPSVFQSTAKEAACAAGTARLTDIIVNEQMPITTYFIAKPHFSN